MRLRAKSVNNKIEILYKDPDDEEQYKVEVDLYTVEIRTSEDHDPNVKISDDLGLVLRYPKTDMMKTLEGVTSEVDLYFEVVKYCIDKVYDADNVYDVDDYTDNEMNEFIQSLDVGTFKGIQQFLETMPKLYCEAAYKDKAGNDKKVVLQNLNDFFMLG